MVDRSPVATLALLAKQLQAGRHQLSADNMDALIGSLLYSAGAAQGDQFSGRQTCSSSVGSTSSGGATGFAASVQDKSLQGSVQWYQ